MARLHKLERDLGRLFRGKAPRKPDTQRKSRERAKALAAEHDIEIEKMEGGMNVWPPKGLPDVQDPFAGEHYACDWNEALGMVEQYAALMAVASPAPDQAA